jgi:hypothetical protein
MGSVPWYLPPSKAFDRKFICNNTAAEQLAGLAGKHFSLLRVCVLGTL